MSGMRVIPKDRATKKEIYLAVNRFFLWTWHQIGHDYPEKDRIMDILLYGCLDESRMLKAIDGSVCGCKKRQ